MDRTASVEMWLPVPGYEGHYEVSDLGRVKSVSRVCHDAIGRHRHLRERIMTLQFDKNKERYVINLHTRELGSRRYSVATLVLQAFVGPRPEGMQCCHNNGIATDDRASNLRWDTTSENIYDQVRHGTHPEATKTHCARGHVLRHPNLVRCTLMTSRLGQIVGRHCLACSRARANAAHERKMNRPALDMQLQSDYHYARIMREPVNDAA